jgi:IS605 OrfB family transposase
VYQLNVVKADPVVNAPSTVLDAIPGVVPSNVPDAMTGVFVRLSFYSGPRVAKATGATKTRVDAIENDGFSLEPVTFQLHRRDLDRFQAMLDDGFKPKQPTISLRRDGKLVLGIPFELVLVANDEGDACNAQPDEIEMIAGDFIGDLITRDENEAIGPIIKDGWNRLDELWNPPAKKQGSKHVARIVKMLRSIIHSGTIVVSAGDLGLKTDITNSIVRALKLADGTYCLANIHCPDEARYFITQEQLHGNRLDWLLPGFDPREHAGPGNLKRDLHHLIKDIRCLQSDIDTFKNEHPGDYKRHSHFHGLHDQLGNKWEKVRNIHDELARQFATRLVAACEFHDVAVLRLEDLSWSRHSRKQDVNYYLKSNQIHWFFSKVQSYATGLARLAGIDVELVNARYTSQDCSRCHKRGDRKRKIFKCPHCGLQLDADLNAARNIAVAPTSRFGTFKAPRGLSPRATRHPGQALPRPLTVEPQPLVHDA